MNQDIKIKFQPITQTAISESYHNIWIKPYEVCLIEMAGASSTLYQWLKKKKKITVNQLKNKFKPMRMQREQKH